jgi:hypothetical protein
MPFLGKGDNKMKLQSKARASVECELNEGFAQVKNDNKISLTTEGCAIVTRNSRGVSLLLEGAVK